MRDQLPGDARRMPGSKGNANEISGDLRTAIPSQIELATKVPGSGETPVVPGSGWDAVGAQSMLDYINGVAANVEGKLATSIVSTKEELDTICNGLQNRFIGESELILDKLRQICIKIGDKLASGMSLTMRQIYSYMQSAGIPVPGPQDVQTAIATGNATSWIPQELLPTGTNSGTLPQPIATLPSGTGGDSTGNNQGETQNDSDQSQVTLPLLPGSRLKPPGGIVPPPPGGIIGGEPCQWIPQPDGSMRSSQVCTPFDATPCCGGPPQGDWCFGHAESPNGTFYNYCVVTPGPCLPTVVGGSGNDGGTGQCPPGYMPADQGGFQGTDPFSGTLPTGGTGGMQLHTRQLPSSPQPVGTPPPNQGTCFPSMPSGVTQSPDPGSVNDIGGFLFGAPWLDGSTRIGGWYAVQVCIDICDNPDGSIRQVSISYPAGFNLYVDNGGRLVWGRGNASSLFTPVTPSQCLPQQPPPPPATLPGGGGGGGSNGNVPPGCIPIPGGEVCPPLPPIDCKGPPGKAPPLGGPQADDFCKAIEDEIAKYKAGLPNITDIIGMANGQEKPTGFAAGLMQGLLGDDNPVLPSLVQRFAAWLKKTVDDSAKGVNCDPIVFAPLVGWQAVLGFIDKWTGAIPAQVLDDLKNHMNYLCQVKLPSQGEVDREWLKGQIDDDEWKCLTKANGNRIHEAQDVRDAGRLRLNARETIHAWMRQLINDDRKDKLLRQNGVTDDTDKSDLVTMEQYWPSWSEIIEFMAKDAFDSDTIDKFNLDKGFEANYTQELQAYAQGAGISDDLMRYKWRTHWRNLGPQEMIRAFQRLRPDRVSSDVAVSEDDLRSALQQQDIMPYWQDRLIAIGYRVITEPEAVQLFNMHKFDEDELKEKLKDTGLSDSDAQDRTDYYSKMRTINDYRTAGYPSIAQATQMYAQCLMDTSTFSDIVNALAVSDQQASIAFDAAELKRQMHVRRVSLSSIQYSYRYGLIDDMTAQQELSQAGIDPECAMLVMRQMKQNRQQKPRELTAAQLCKLRKQGIITAQVQLLALTRVNWSLQDAERITESCTVEMEQAALKQHQKDMAAAAKLAKQEQAAAAKATKASTKKQKA